MSEDKTNPKDLIGVKKVSTFVFPSTALLHGSHAMMNGASKYGPYNWREKKVKASIYLDALERHITAWKEREEIAEDSGVHHLGHALACIAIIIDAMETGGLIDDRPKNGEGTLKLLARLNEAIKKG
jgi:dATP/dGTP diphosphohydrolase